MQSLHAAFEWLFSDRSLAPATWGLVLVTALLVLDGARKSREQKRQWDEERKLRQEEAKPSAVVEIVVKEESPLDMRFAVFNLGRNSFFIDRMIVRASDGTRSESDLTPSVVTPGTWVTIDFDPKVLLGVFGENTQFKEASCEFLLKGAFGTVATEPEWFYVTYGRDRTLWYKGRLSESRLPGVIAPQPKVIKRSEA